MTDIDPRHREFFEKLKGLLKEYDVRLVPVTDLILFEFAQGRDEYTREEFDGNASHVYKSHEVIYL